MEKAQVRTSRSMKVHGSWWNKNSQVATVLATQDPLWTSNIGGWPLRRHHWSVFSWRCSHDWGGLPRPFIYLWHFSVFPWCSKSAPTSVRLYVHQWSGRWSGGQTTQRNGMNAEERKSQTSSCAPCTVCHSMEKSREIFSSTCLRCFSQFTAALVPISLHREGRS